MKLRERELFPAAAEAVPERQHDHKQRLHLAVQELVEALDAFDPPSQRIALQTLSRHFGYRILPAKPTSPRKLRGPGGRDT